MTPDRGNSPADTAPLSARADGSGVVDRAWTHDWFDSPNAIFRPGLSLSVHARLVYLYLCRRDADRGKAFPGYTRMAADCGVSRRTAIHAVQELCAVGLITYTPGNHERANRYILFHPEDSGNTLRGATWRRDHPTTPRSGGSTSGSAPRALGQDVHQLVHGVHPNKTHDQDPDPNNNSTPGPATGVAVVVESPALSSEPGAPVERDVVSEPTLLAFLTASPVGLKRTVARDLVAQYPDRVKRVRAYVAGLSEPARARIQNWPGFVRRAVLEDFRWSDPEPLARRSNPPATRLTALVCPDPACGYDMLSAQPAVVLQTDPPACPYCGLTMVHRAYDPAAG